MNAIGYSVYQEDVAMEYEFKSAKSMGIVMLSGHKCSQDAKDACENIRQSVQKNAFNAVLIIDTSVSELNPVQGNRKAQKERG
jgi:fructose-1-phosphate kinase PfkB-like protein